MTPCPHCNFPRSTAPLEEGEVAVCRWCDHEDELSEVFPFLQEDEEDAISASLSPDDTLVISGETEPECCICYDKIDAQRNNCVTECGHRFCFKCLAISMMHNTACPCCRSPLVESEDDEEEGSDADTEDEYQEDADEDETGCDPEELTRRLAAQGFTMQDMVSMLLGRYNQNVSDAAIFELNKRFDVIVDEADNEELETEAMGREDRAVVCV